MSNQAPNIRVGHGFDLHRLAPLTGSVEHGKPLVLGGIRLVSEAGPIAHSDGDALLHAITDAILGAAAMPDIGQLFPDTDPKWAGAASEGFLAEAAASVKKVGWSIANVDATVILERPKLGPHKEDIRKNIARILGLHVSQVNIKGKTHERVDAVGEGRAVEAHAVVLLTQSRG